MKILQYGAFDKAAVTTDKRLTFMHYKKAIMCLAFVFITILKYLPDIITYPSVAYVYKACVIFTCISLVPICMYNGKQGPKVKYLFYAFYPVHLFILYFLSKI